MDKKEKLKFISRVTFMVFLFLVSCSSLDEEPYPYSSENTIYSQSGQNVLRELMFMLKPYLVHENEKKYIVVSSITNIKVLINGKEWGAFQSFEIDVSRINTETAGNFYVRSEPVKYVTKAPYLISTERLTTAGEYSELLGRYISLQPGGYIFQIEHIEIIDNNGKTHLVYPLIAEHFEVRENVVSAYIGEFEILID